MTTRVAAVLLFLAAVGAALGPVAAAPREREVLTLEWPDQTVQRELNAYLIASLLNIKQTSQRPTLDERLAARPFAIGEGRVGIDLSALDLSTARALRAVASPAGAGLALSQEAFFPTAEKLYLERRYFMGQISHLRKSLHMDSDPLWSSVEVLSVVTRTRRRIWFHAGEVVITAVTAMERGGSLVYRPGTWFLVDDLDARGQVTETHVLGKRADWEWDFAIYDARGVVAPHSPSLGTEMRVPTSCFRCHRTSGRLPPFADFPGPSAEMNGMTPRVDVTLTPAEQAIVRAFQGRAAAEDAMGDYAGLAALKFRKVMRAPGPHPEWMQGMWKRLVRLVPALDN